MKEKDIALDIARRTRQHLKENGFKAYITRNADHFITLVDRVQLARQLKAGLFVSIHVNSFPAIPSISGVETHFFDDRYVWGKGRNMSFLLADGQENKKLISVAHGILKKKIADAQLLSRSIQASVIQTIRQDFPDVIDRGIRKTGLRTLFRCEMPASFIEVGFLTNKDEAKRMSQKHYRDLLAKGVCNGIIQYLS